MGLRMDPVGGGQFQQALKKILEVERQPIENLEGRKKLEEDRLKLFQEFKGKFMKLDGALAQMSSFKQFRELKADLGDGSAMAEVSINKDVAEPGNYELEIQKLAQRAAVISNSFENADQKILGIGYVVMNLENGDSTEIFIDEDAASLNGVASEINKTKDSPVRASVIRDASNPERPFKLLLTAKTGGDANNINFPDFYFIGGDEDFRISEDRSSENGMISMDGFELETDTNDVANFLPGVNVKFKQAKPGVPFSLTITEDTAKIAGKMKEFVDELSGVLEFINKQNQIDAKSDTRSTFAGDTLLQSVEWRLRNLVHEGFASTDYDEDSFRVIHMNELGVTFSKTGQLAFDEKKFQTSLEKDFAGVANAIAGDRGFAFQMRTVITGYTRGGTGMLANREQGIRARIKGVEDNIDQKTRQFENKAQALTERFARLQGTMASLQRQGQFMQASMGGGGGNNVVSQLLGG